MGFGGALRVAVAITCVSAASSYAAGIKSERLLAAIVKETPQVSLVAHGEEMSRAEAAAAQIPGAAVFWGVGESMEPLYPSNTAVVVAPRPFKHLKKGMTVIYVNRRGRMVAHALTGDLPKGWIAQGVNNDKEDDDLVTEENLVGIVVLAYAEIHSELRLALTERLVANGRFAAGLRARFSFSSSFSK
jgi:hypothetical protein